jgi:thioredoxin 1
MNGEIKLGLVLVAVCVAAIVFRYHGRAPRLTDKDVIARQSAYQAALDESHRSGKPLVIDFYADWCGPCRWMHENTWNDVRVQRAMQDFVFMPVNIDGNRELSHLFGVGGIPYVVVISPDGNILCSQTGAVPPDRLLGWLPPPNHQTAAAQ